MNTKKSNNFYENKPLPKFPTEKYYNSIMGNVFGRLTPLSFHSMTNRGMPKFLCKCYCGKECLVNAPYLKNGHTTSCGCASKEALLRANFKHGHATNGNPTPEYNSWFGMLKRCYEKNTKNFHDYGGRGITVCDRWRHSFQNFLDDMGLKPSPKHSIDRFPNNDGNYEPTNCRWGTKKEQTNNTRATKRATYNGITKTYTEWEDYLKMPPSTLSKCIRKGQSFETIYNRRMKLKLKRYGI